MSSENSNDRLSVSASRGVIVTLVAQMSKILLTLVSVVILARLLDASDFGLVGLILSIIGIAEILRDVGLSTAAIQAPVLTAGQRTNLFWLNTLLGAVAALCVALAAPVLASAYHMPQLLWPTITLAIMFLFNGAAAQYVASLARDLRFNALAGSQLAAQVLGLVVAIGLALGGAGYWALVGQQMTISAATLIASAILGAWLPGLPDRHSSVRSFLRFGGATVISQGATYASRNLDMLALGFVATAPVLGFYNRAAQLVSVPLDQINAPLTRVAIPVLSRVKDEISIFQRYLDRAQLFTCYGTATGLFVLAGLATPTVDLLLGAKWEPVAPLLAILAIGGVFRSISQVIYWSYLAQGLAKEQLHLYVGVKSVLVILILAGLPWGAVGVATAYAMVQFLFWLAGLWHIQHVSPVRAGPLLRRSLASIVGLGIPAGLIANYVSSALEGPLMQLTAGGIAAGFYCILVAALVRPFRNDALTIFRFVQGSFTSKASG